LVDPKELKSESVLTHPCGPEESGEAKVVAAARRVQAVSPGTRIEVFKGGVEALPADAFSEVDAVLLATDNAAAEIEAGQRCLHLGRPLIHAAVQPEMLVAQVRCFGNEDAQGACPACGLGPADYELLRRQVAFSCAGNVVAGGAPARAASRTLCSLAADLAVNQLVRLVLGLGVPVSNSIVEYCGYTNATSVSPLRRNPDCRCDHTRFERVRLEGPLGGATVDALVGAAGLASANGLLLIRVSDHAWVERANVRVPDLPVHQFVRRGALRGAPAAAARFSRRNFSFVRTSRRTNW